MNISGDLISQDIRTEDKASDWLIANLGTVSNSNWTEWSTIQGVIARVIQNRTSAKREADLKIRARGPIIS